MILHTVNKPAPHQALELCLRFVAEDDIVLLLEDGVYNAMAASTAAMQLQDATVNRIVALQPDIIARGLEGKQTATVELIDYQAFVELCCQCDKVQSWF